MVFADFAQTIGTAATTVVLGVLVIVGGQIIQNAFLDPIKEQAGIITDVAAALVMYANLYTNFGVGDEYEKKVQVEAGLEIRRQAARLQARNQTIPWYELWQRIRLAPPRRNLLIVSSNLIFIANSTPPRDRETLDRNVKYREEIEILLGIGSTAPTPSDHPTNPENSGLVG